MELIHIPAVTGAAQTRPARAAVSTERKGNAAKRFDTVSISGKASGRSPFEMRLRSKVTQEARATGTAGNLSALRSQVQAGTYEIDAVTVARQMLLMPEEV